MNFNQEWMIGKTRIEWGYRSDFWGLGLEFFTTTPLFIQMQVGPLTIWITRDI